MFEALFLGLIQGLTEFLPISSSAHLRFAGEFLPSASDPGATFTAITQIGTELAVLIYFRRDIWRIASAWIGRVLLRRDSAEQSAQDVRLGWLIILGSLPIVVLGYAFQENIRNTFRSLWLIAIVMIVFGAILGIADKFGRSQRNLSTLSSGHGFAYGVAQSLAPPSQWVEFLAIPAKVRCAIHFCLPSRLFLGAACMNLRVQSAMEIVTRRIP